MPGRLWSAEVFPSTYDDRYDRRFKPRAEVRIEGRTALVLFDGNVVWGVSSLETFGGRVGFSRTQAYHLAQIVRTVLERRARRR